MTSLDRYLFGPIAAVRPYLLLKAVLALLALDAWVVMTEHGGRYGVGEFNVSHFGWLDALQPVPSSGLYVGIILFVGLLAFAVTAGGVQRIALGAMALLYTYAWMMSMLDSYQHHYLLSILLVGFVGWPAVTGRQVFGHVQPPEPQSRQSQKKKRRRRPQRSFPRLQQGPLATAWAYPLVCVSIALVYAWTAIAKTEQAWREGYALQQIAPAKLAPFEAYFVGDWGMAPGTFWPLVGHSVIMLQVVIAAGYLVAPMRDRGDAGLRVVSWIGFAAALSFHLGAEYLELRIGWFSWYMVLVACVCFLPPSWLWVFGAVITWPVRRLGGAWDALVEREGFGAAMPAAVAAGGVAVLAGWLVDLPGSIGAGAAAAVAAVAVTAWLLSRGRRAETLRWIAACAGGALCMWLAVASSDVRFDYYRKVGGVMRRHQQWEEALEAYEKANLYAPEGEDRREKEAEVRRMVELERARGGAQ